MKITAILNLCAIATILVPNLSAQSALNGTPSRTLGQPQLTLKSSNPNSPEGREFFVPWSVAVDKSSTPAPLYVADTGNNRVLGWKNSAQFTAGAPADLLIGQLDRVSTFPLGPGTSRSNGLNAPAAVAVDAQGNLYVADAGNNRILRYPKPFANPTEEFKNPDMVIGQTNFTSNQANHDGISEKTIALSATGQLGRTGLAFDAQGNLFFSDALNHRVLRYPAAALAAGGNGPAADVVLGQPTFTSNTPAAATPEGRADKTALRFPSGIGVDNAGRVYVVDSLYRALVFVPPFFNGSSATRIAGIGVATPMGAPPGPLTTEYTIGNPSTGVAAEGVVIINNALAVVDTGFNRIIRYDPYDQWPPEADKILSPPAKQVIGQADFASNRANRGQAEASEATLNGPIGAYFANNELYVADTSNNRVVVFSQLSTGAVANRVLGQLSFNFNAPNLIEGKEFFLYNGSGASSNVGGAGSDGAGIIIDSSSNPPRLYVADTFNNRILGFKDARQIRPGDTADLVIGQNDLNRSLINAPQGDRDVITDSGLFHPSGLAVDANGNLYVADSGNSRVLRFPRPFDQPKTSDRPRANLVLGQLSGSSKITDASSRTMSFPYGLAFTVDGHLLVSDAALNRVLFFRKPSGGDFTTGMSAEKVIGQADFFTGTRVTGIFNRLTNPRGIATDTDDRLYVADTGNNRIVIYDRIVAAANDPQPAVTVSGLSSPQGVYVSAANGEIWVANTNNNQAVRFPRFDKLTSVPTRIMQSVAGSAGAYRRCVRQPLRGRRCESRSCLLQRIGGYQCGQRIGPPAVTWHDRLYLSEGHQRHLRYRHQVIQ
jgi:NHL repeat.